MHGYMVSRMLLHVLALLAIFSKQPCNLFLVLDPLFDIHWCSMSLMKVLRVCPVWVSHSYQNTIYKMNEFSDYFRWNTAQFLNLAKTNLTPCSAWYLNSLNKGIERSSQRHPVGVQCFFMNINHSYV